MLTNFHGGLQAVDRRRVEARENRHERVKIAWE